MNVNYTINYSECKNYTLCSDCNDNTCPLSGRLIADCPKNRCDRPEPHVKECETCEPLKEYQREMRELYGVKTKR